MRTLWRKHFLVLEGLVAAAIATGVIVWSERFQGKACLDEILTGNRSDIYSAAVSVFGALLGFVLTAVSIVLGFSSLRQFRVLRASPHYRTLYDIYFQATWILAVTTLASLIGLVIDRDSDPSWPIFYAVLVLCLLASARVARCVWALEQAVLVVIGKKSSESGT